MKKIIMFLLIIAVVQVNGQIKSRVDWFREARFGMFVHFGLYSILGGSYNGHTMPDKSLKQGNSWYAEWIQQRLEVPKDAYQALAKSFNPEQFDAEKWVSEAKNAGMKYFVITAKHHDGFALWDSKVSDYDLGASPYRNDILGALAQACRKQGLKFGLYYSHCEDWEHPGGALPSWLPRKTDNAFETYWNQKCLPQVKELIDRYHPDLFWFDTWGDEQERLFISDKRRDELIALIRKESPKTLINGRISWLNPGNDIDFLEMLDNEYPKAMQQLPWQTPATMVHSWGWHAGDYHWKPVSELLGNLAHTASKGGNYLLNVGPKPDGSFPAAAIQRLRAMGGWLVANGEAIDHTTPVPGNLKTNKSFYLTQKNTDTGTNIYVSVVNMPSDGTLSLPVASNTIKSCTLLESGMPVQYTADADKKMITIVLKDQIAPIQPGNIPVIKIVQDKQEREN